MVNEEIVRCLDGDAVVIKKKGCFKILPRVPDLKKLYIEVTTKCNLDCITCVRHSWQDPLEIMTMETFHKIIDSLSDLPQLEKVHFGGFGEPMSHPNFMEMVEKVRNRGLQVEIITNGTLLSEHNLERLIKLGVDTVVVSLDGPDEETYQGIRHGGHLDPVLRNLEKLNELKTKYNSKVPKLGVEFVATKANYHKLINLVRLTEKLKAQFLLVTNVMPYNEEMKDQILYDLDDEQVIYSHEETLIAIKAQLPQMKLRTDRQCRFVERKAMTVNHQGKVSPCYALMHSYDCYIYGRKKEMKAYFLGDVNEESLRDIWTKPEYVILRNNLEEFNYPSCTDCKYRDGCSFTEDNLGDCWGNSPSCADCLWARGMIVCP